MYENKPFLDRVFRRIESLVRLCQDRNFQWAFEFPHLSVFYYIFSVSSRVFLMPRPRAFDDLFEFGVLRFPAKDLTSFCSVGDES